MRRKRKTIARQLEPPSGYSFHILKGAAAALGSAYQAYARGEKMDVATSLAEGFGHAAVSYAQEMGLGADKKHIAYERRASQPMSKQTCAVTRLGRPMSECDECGSTMPRPPIEAIDDGDDFRALWVYGKRDHGDDDGDIYFMCSPICHQRRKVRVVRDGYRFR